MIYAPFKASKNTKTLIFELWELERKVDKLLDYQYDIWGGTFRRLSTGEIESLIWMEKRKDQLKKELRERMGFWKYLNFAFDPVGFAKKYF